MDDEKKERIVEGFWKVVVGSGVGNVEDLFTFKAAMRMVRAMRKLDEDTKNDMSEAVRLFKNAYKKMQSDRHKSRRRSFYP